MIQEERPTREYAISLLSDRFRQAAESLPEDLAKMSEVELEDKRKPTHVDYMLRKNFWEQVRLAQRGGIQWIKAIDVYRGVCSHQNFEDRVITNPIRVAWLLSYPEEPHELLETGLSIGLKNLIKFISKEPDATTAAAFMKAMEMLLNRVQGPVVQRIEARHAHAHLNVNGGSQVRSTNPEDVQARLNELKAKLLNGGGGGS